MADKIRRYARRKGRRCHDRIAGPLVTCHHCKGAGKLPLSDDMLLTLDAVKYLQEADVIEVKTAVLWEGHTTAINNRLEDLRKLGLLTRKRDGRRWLYRPNEKLKGDTEPR